MLSAAVNNSTAAVGHLPEDNSGLTDFRRIYLPLVVVFGALGNFIIFRAVCSDRVCSSFHNAVFIFGLSLVDMCYLLVLTVMWLRIFELDVYNRPGWCQTWTLMGFICEFLSIWFTAGLVVECLLLDRWRTRLIPGGWFPTWRPRIFAISVTIIGVVVYINITLLFGVTSGVKGKCLPLPMYVQQIKLLNEVDVFVNVLVPYIIIAVSVFLLVIKCVRHIVEKRQTRTHERSRYSVVHEDSDSGRRMVLWLALVFLFSTAPSRLIRFWQTLSDIIYGHQLYHRNGHLVIIQHALIQLSFSRCILNFLVYLLTWAPFRKYVIHCSCPAAREYEEPGDTLEMETEMDFVSTAVENSDNELIELQDVDRP